MGSQINWLALVAFKWAYVEIIVFQLKPPYFYSKEFSRIIFKP